MPAIDITVDTNVLMHASNPTEERQAHAVQFLQDLIACNTVLCIDEGFDIDEARNRSLIGGEYHGRLTPGQLGHTVITHLARNGRVVTVSKKVSQARSRLINQMIRNKRDRTFVRVSLNSNDHVFVSHDCKDFAAAKRQAIATQLGVSMPDAQAACALLP